MSPRHTRLAGRIAALAIPVGTLFFNPEPLLAESGSHVHSTGTVGLKELIGLALQNDPGLVALRKNVPIEEARKRNAVQWRDPELRLGLSRDDNIQLDQPFTRSGSTTESFSEGGNRSETGGANGNALRSENASGTRTTTFTEQVIPGGDSDRVIRTETERIQTESNISITDNRGTTNVNGSEDEIFQSTTDETFFHGRDRFARDQTASVRVRFWIPKPAEMKALVEQAARRVELANFEILAAERSVVLEIREQYEALQFLSRKLEASKRQIAIIEEHARKERELLDAGGAFTLDQLSFEDLKLPGIQLTIEAAEMELKAAKSALAARVGFSDGSKIRVTDSLVRSGIDLQSTDLDYLTLMAFAHRGEVGVLTHEQAIVESELGIVKSKRIPWFSFVDAAYAQDSTGGHHTNDNYGVQVGIILPLFSLISKEEEVFEAQLESYYAMLEANQKNIANEVAAAFEMVIDANRHRTRTAGAVKHHAASIEKRARGLDASEDLAAREQLRYDAESELNKIYEHQLAADRLFNQSLIRLERALGADLDQVLKVEFEPLPTPTPARDRETITKPAGSPAPILIRAVPVSEIQTGDAPEEATKNRKKGLFRFLKGQENSPP